MKITSLRSWICTLLLAPVVCLGDGVSPSSGHSQGGYPVVITGANLGDGTDITNVTLCGREAIIASQSASQVVVTSVWANVSGPGNVVVTSASRGQTIFTNGFTYNPILSVNAGSGGTVVPVGTPAVVAPNVWELVYGSTESFTVLPYPAYQIVEARLDGISLGPTNALTITNATASHSIQATFFTPTNTQYVNQDAPAPLEITVKNTGTPGVWVSQPNGRTRQYYGDYSWGSIIWLNGTNASDRYSSGYTAGNPVLSPLSNTKTGTGTSEDPYVITTVLGLGFSGVQLNQRFTYINGDRYFQKNWTLTNGSATTYNDLRFFHGGDAYFGGIDSARSWWDSVNQKIYVNNNAFSNSGYMAFYASPATPVAAHFGGSFGTGNAQAGTYAQLSNTADSAYVDAGYYLQWNRASLAPGQTWTIEAYEYWSLPGSLAVMPAANDYVEPDTSVVKVFKVHNLSTNAATVNLLVDGDDWAASLPDGTNLDLTGLEVATVNVSVAVPAGAQADATKDIVLRAVSGVSTGMGTTRLTVLIPSFSITPNPVDFGSVAVGASRDATVILSNDVTGVAMTMGVLANPDGLAAPFSIVSDDASGLSIAPGQTRAVTIRYTPTAGIASDDSFNWPIVSPLVLSRTIAVQGAGLVPGISLLGTNGGAIANGQAASMAHGTLFDNVAVGVSRTHVLSITNTGAASLTISDVSVTGSGAAAFQCSNIPAPIPAGAAAQLSVSFQPVALGAPVASLIISNNASVSPFTVNLAGYGCTISTNSGTLVGGYPITISATALGNGSDITSVTVGGVAATITGQGAGWVTVRAPAMSTGGTKDIVVSSSSLGTTTFYGIYTVTEVNAIPTLSEWGIIALLVILVALGARRAGMTLVPGSRA